MIRKPVEYTPLNLLSVSKCMEKHSREKRIATGKDPLLRLHYLGTVSCKSLGSESFPRKPLIGSSPDIVSSQMFQTALG